MTDIKLSVFTVSAPDLTPAELAQAAGRAGIRGIEWRYQDVPPGQENDKPSFWGNNRCSIPKNWNDETLAAFRQAAQDGGVESIAVVPYLSCGDLAGTERVLQAAQRLGAKTIRLGVHRYERTRHFSDLFREQREYLKQAEALCGLYGIQGLIETHHETIAASASAAYRLVEGADPARLGVLYDPGNMVFEGFENYRMGMELLGPYLAHVHMKNAAWQSTRQQPDGSLRWRAGWSGLDQGVVDWAQVTDDLRTVGYAGWIGIEDFSQTFGTEDMLRNFAAYAGRLLG